MVLYIYIRIFVATIYTIDYNSLGRPMLGTHWLPKHWSLPAAWQAAGPVAIGRPCSNRSLSGPWPLGRPAPKRMMRWTVSGKLETHVTDGDMDL